MKEKSKLLQKNKRNNEKSGKNFILYLDTSEPVAVIAIYSGKKLVKEEKWHGHRELAASLSKKYLNILKDVGISQDDLEGICVFKGPGSFTGLRIGISFANGLAYGLKIPIYGTLKRSKLDLSKPEEVIVPEYGAPAKITKPKKK